MVDVGSRRKVYAVEKIKKHRRLIEYLGVGFECVGVFLLGSRFIWSVSILCLMLGFVLRTTVRRSRDLFWFLGWGLFALLWMVHIFCTSRADRLFSVTGLIAVGVFWWLSEKKERALAEEAGEKEEDHFPW